MAIVKSYVHPTIGCQIVVHDDDYRDVSPEKMAERRRNLDRVIARILSNPENCERLRQYNLEHYGHE